MTRSALNRISFVVPIALSALALALVLGNVAAGVKPSADENASAHIFQLLIAAEIPLIGAFVLTSGLWTKSARLRLSAQILALAAPILAVWLAGY